MRGPAMLAGVVAGVETRSRGWRLLPLVLAATATQASIVVLAPLIVPIGEDLGASDGAVGTARSVLAAFAFAGALAIGPLIDRVGVRPLIVRGGAIACAGAVASAASPTIAVFYAAHAITGIGVACLLSAGFAGVGSYFHGRERAWAMGYVVGTQSLAWIVGNPIVGALADAGSWRLSYAVPAAVCLAAVAGGLTLPRRGEAVTDTGEPDTIRAGLAAVARDRSARRWAIAETVAYSAWTGELTYAGAFYIRQYGVDITAVGLLLAVGSLVFLVASLNAARLMARVPRKPLLIGSAVGMGLLLIPILNWAPSVWVTLALFCPMALCAGLRLAGSSSLGLELLPARPGAMMGARTASAQLGYMVGAAAGGAIIAVWGFGTLGFVLCAGMVLSALLLIGVHDPTGRPGPASAARHAAEQPAPVAD